MWPVSTAPWVAPLHLPGSHFPFIFSLAPFGHFSFSVCFSVTSSFLHCFCFFLSLWFDELQGTGDGCENSKRERELLLCVGCQLVSQFRLLGYLFLNSSFRNREDTILQRTLVWNEYELIHSWDPEKRFCYGYAVWNFLQTEDACFICIICSTHLVPRLRSLLLCLSIIPSHWRQESRMKWNYRITKRRNQFKQLLKILGT